MPTNKDVQTALRGLGYYTGKIDGDIGPASRNAILEALTTADHASQAPIVVPPSGDGHHVTADGRAKIEQREAVKLRAYQDTKGVWTIGVGHTAAAGDPKPVAGMTITREQADAILMRDLGDVESVIGSTVKVPLKPYEFDALASLILNIGEGNWRKSSILSKLNANDKPGAANAFMNWTRSGNDPDILKGRREGERKQFIGA